MDSRNRMTIANDDQEEVTLIVVDNSQFMWSNKRTYDNQLEAIELYCRAKLESNPKKNAIGLYAMGCPGLQSSYLKPTSDVDKILAHLHKGIMYGGDLDISWRIHLSSALVDRCIGFKHKRLLFFVGGPTVLSDHSAKTAGQILNQMGVAVNVVNFFLREKYKNCRTALEIFVAAADNNGNSHIQHVPPGSSLRVISKALSSLGSPPIITPAVMERVEVAADARKKIHKERPDSTQNLNRSEELGLLNRLVKYQVASTPPPPPKAPRINLGDKFDLLTTQARMKSIKDQVNARAIEFKSDQNIIAEVTKSTNREHELGVGRRLPMGTGSSSRINPEPKQDYYTREQITEIIRQEVADKERWKKAAEEAKQEAELAKQEVKLAKQQAKLANEQAARVELVSDKFMGHYNQQQTQAGGLSFTPPPLPTTLIPGTVSTSIPDPYSNDNDEDGNGSDESSSELDDE